MKRIRIVHTADLHLGSSFAAMKLSAEQGNYLRTAQLSAFKRILSQVQQCGADALIIAGDLFDNLFVDSLTLDYVLEGLGQVAPAQVYIAPGNRDPYTPESPYALEMWPDNVTVFSAGQWQSVQHSTLPLTVHGYGFDGRNDSGDWFRTLNYDADGRIHVVVAHGTERDHKPPEGKTFAPFSVNDLLCLKPAYIALGHFHQMTNISVADAAPAYYPGTPQGRNFQECGEKLCLQVEISYDDDVNVQTTVTPFQTTEVLWEHIEIPISQMAEAGTLLDAHARKEQCERAVAIHVQGERPLFFEEHLAGLKARAQALFLHVEIIDDTTLASEPCAIFREKTCLAKLADTMQAKIQDERDRDAAVLEMESLETALKVCLGVDLPSTDLMDQNS